MSEFKQKSYGIGGGFQPVDEAKVRAIVDEMLLFRSAPIRLKTETSYIEGSSGSTWKIEGDGITLSDLKAGSQPSILGWQNTMTFSATDYNTVSWTSGIISLSDGTTFSIDAGNTGNMSAITYIYLDTGTSETALQTSTTASDAVGTNKILVGVAQNNTDTASDATFQVFGGTGGVLLTTENLAANTVTANEIAANTITSNEITTGELITLSAQIKNAIITSAKIVSLNADKINVGTLTGFTIQTATTGYRSIMTSANGFQCYNGATYQSSMYADSSSAMVLHSIGNIYLRKGSDQMAHFTGNSVDFPTSYYQTWAGQGRIQGNSGYLKIEGTTGGVWDLRVEGNVYPDSDNAHTCGASDKRWSGGWFEDISVDDLTVNTGCTGCEYNEMNLMNERQKNKYLKGKKKEKTINPTGFEQGDVLVWKFGGLRKCKKDMCECVVAVANKNGLPTVLGAEPIKVIGKVSQGDFLVTSEIEGYAKAEKNPRIGTVIAKALQANKQGKGLVKAMIKNF